MVLNDIIEQAAIDRNRPKPSTEKGILVEIRFQHEHTCTIAHIHTNRNCALGVLVHALLLILIII